METEDPLSENDSTSHGKVMELVFENDEITWQSILQDLVRNGEINPWDVDISYLAKKYLETVKELKELDLRVSGKIILAAALLLKIKSNRLMGEDLAGLDRLFHEPEDIDDLDFEEDPLTAALVGGDKPTLIPRMPQPRQRKVTIFDLLGALEQALEVKKRKVLRDMPPAQMQIPEKKQDISENIKQVYTRVRQFFDRAAGRRLTFNQLVPSTSREDMIYTFIPLLHLTNQRKVDLHQFQHLGEIEIELLQHLTEQQVRQDLSRPDAPEGGVAGTPSP